MPEPALKIASGDDVMDSEFRRYLAKCQKAGIGSDIVLSSPEDVSSAIFTLDLKGKSKGSDILKDVADKAKIWSKTNVVFFVTGGDSGQRRKIASFITSRAILHNLGEPGEIGAVMSYSEIIAVFNSFSDSRFTLAENMKRIRCLHVSDFNDDMLPRAAGDAMALFNGVLESRRNWNKPTIISMATASDGFLTKKPVPRIWGNVFAELVGVDRSGDENNVFFLRLGRKGHD